MTPVNLAHTRKVTLRQQPCSTDSLPLTCKVYFNYTSSESSPMQKHVHLWHTAHTKSTKLLRDSDMLEIVNLTPMFNWISRSLTNTTARSNISHHTTSVLGGTPELKITKMLPQYQVTTWFQLFEWKSCNYIIHKKVITTTDFANSNKCHVNQKCPTELQKLSLLLPSPGAVRASPLVSQT